MHTALAENKLIKKDLKQRCVAMTVCAGAAEADRGRAPRLLPAAGVHPAVQVVHGSVPPPPPAQPGASAAQPQGGEKVSITRLQKNNITHKLERSNETYCDCLDLIC